MIDYTEIRDGDDWEAFCRDYLGAKGLVVEVPPGRGADDGRDLLMKEHLRGQLANRSFTLARLVQAQRRSRPVGRSREALFKSTLA